MILNFQNGVVERENAEKLRYKNETRELFECVSEASLNSENSIVPSNMFDSSSSLWILFMMVW